MSRIDDLRSDLKTRFASQEKFNDKIEKKVDRLINSRVKLRDNWKIGLWVILGAAAGSATVSESGLLEILVKILTA